MSAKLVDVISRRIGTGVSRRGLFRGIAAIGSALTVAPWTYIMKPGSAYAAICQCGGENCNCGDLCCRGYTEFCCTITGSNSCPPGTVAAGWWKADGSGFCDTDGAARPRYYLDCNKDNCSCGCNSKGVCGPECVDCSCGCADGDCRNRRACCVKFRYGQCNQHRPCLGPILCRVVTCTPPWEIDASCTRATLRDNNTKFHDAPCLHSESFHSWIIGGTLVVQDRVHTHLASCDALGGVKRISGGSRYSTAAAVSREFNPDPGAIDKVFIVTGANFPDALSVGPVAAMTRAPILLTQQTALPSSTREEILRLQPKEIVVVGGTSVISPSVLAELDALASSTRRISGMTRYETSSVLSREFFEPQFVSKIYIATGANFPDSLAVGPVAAAAGAPVLLVEPDKLPGVTRTEIERLSPGEIIVVGGEAAVSRRVFDALGPLARSVRRISGSDRYATAAKVSKDVFVPGASEFAFIVTGESFADALAVAPVAAAQGGPVLLVARSFVPKPTADELARLGNNTCPPLA